jgi:predicted nucleic acid-binding protein
MVYLIEKGSIDAAALTRLAAELDAADAVLVEMPVDRRVVQAMRHIARADVPDMPDRIIAATALHLGLPIISRDRKIETSGLTVIW